MTRASTSSISPASYAFCEPSCAFSSPDVAINLMRPFFSKSFSLISIIAMAKAASPDFISAAPRPYSMPSSSVRVKGSYVHCSCLPSGTTSIWPEIPSTGEPSPISAIKFPRCSSSSWIRESIPCCLKRSCKY